MVNYAETTSISTDVPLSPVPSTVEKQEIPPRPSSYDLDSACCFVSEGTR
jgi:hypothetical protein